MTFEQQAVLFFFTHYQMWPWLILALGLNLNYYWHQTLTWRWMVPTFGLWAILEVPWTLLALSRAGIL